jgi:hypothetical protein
VKNLPPACSNCILAQTVRPRPGGYVAKRKAEAPVAWGRARQDRVSRGRAWGQRPGGEPRNKGRAGPLVFAVTMRDPRPRRPDRRAVWYSNERARARIAAQAPTAKDVSKSRRPEVYKPATGEPPTLVVMVSATKGCRTGRSQKGNAR